jgi:type II secretory pathway pseudopilin PulG
MRRDRARGGHSLIELLVALLLLALVATTAVGLLTAGGRLVRGTTNAAEAVNATGFAARLLRSEIETLVPTDSHGFDSDSSRQRVFRGSGIVCGLSGGTASVRYRGMRNPDPTKDSTLVLAASGESARALLAASASPPAPCVARNGETVLGLEVPGGLRSGDVVLLFETGTWHLAGSALRYARGAGGRQPLTPSVFVDDSTGITVDTAGAVPLAVRLALAAMPAGATAASMIRERHRIAMLNTRAPLDSVVLE